MGQDLEKKICTQHGREKPDQKEWGQPWIPNLGGSQAELASCNKPEEKTDFWPMFQGPDFVPIPPWG
jgi:hypothetical protein